MSRLRLTLACLDYDRVKPLMTGAVQPVGIDLNILPYPADWSVWPMIRHQEFDVSEMTLASYAVLRSWGDAPYTAIPAFLARTFVHAGLFVNARSGVREPKDLEGKRVAAGQYLMSFAVWARGTLQHEYGVDLRSIHWLTARPEASYGLPAGVKIGLLPEGRTLPDRLADGEFDALIAPRIPPQFRKEHPTVRPLFEGAYEVERAYYKRTRVFPILHLVVIRNAILEQHPWVASSLYRAFCDAKAAAYRDLAETLEGTRYTLPWLDDHVQRVRGLMGDDFWPYGVKANRHVLETYVRYLNEQRLIDRVIPVEDLFAPNVLD